MWLNGGDHVRLEPVTPELQPPRIEIDSTLKPECIRQAIADLSTFEIEFNMLHM